MTSSVKNEERLREGRARKANICSNTTFNNSYRLFRKWSILEEHIDERNCSILHRKYIAFHCFTNNGTPCIIGSIGCPIINGAKKNYIFLIKTRTILFIKHFFYDSSFSKQSIQVFSLSLIHPYLTMNATRTCHKNDFILKISKNGVTPCVLRPSHIARICNNGNIKIHSSYFTLFSTYSKFSYVRTRMQAHRMFFPSAWKEWATWWSVTI